MSPVIQTLEGILESYNASLICERLQMLVANVDAVISIFTVIVLINIPGIPKNVSPIFELTLEKVLFIC